MIETSLHNCHIYHTQTPYKIRVALEGLTMIIKQNMLVFKCGKYNLHSINTSFYFNMFIQYIYKQLRKGQE